MTENETVSERDRALGSVVAAHILRRSGQERRANRLERKIGDSSLARDAAQHMAATLANVGHQETATRFAERADAFRQDPALAGDRSTPPPIAGGAPANDVADEAPPSDETAEALRRLDDALRPAFYVEPADWSRIAAAVRTRIPASAGDAQQAYATAALGIEEAVELYGASEAGGDQLRARTLYEHALYGGMLGARIRFTAQTERAETVASRYAETARLLRRQREDRDNWRILASYIAGIPAVARQAQVILGQVSERVRYAQSQPGEAGRAIYDGAIGFVEMAARNAATRPGS